MIKTIFFQTKKIMKKIMPDTFIKLYSIIVGKMYFRKYLKQFSNLNIGKNVYISTDCFFGKGVKIYNNVSLSAAHVGDYTYFAPQSSIKSVKIGKYCSIGPNVKIGLGMHPSRDIVSTHPAFFSASRQSTVVFADRNYFLESVQITIGNDVWIGANVIIRDGITIGDGAIIGAGAVVVKNVESYGIMGGVPAKLIRYRFTKEEIIFLKETKWWDKPEEWIKNNWKDFLDIKQFINKNKNDKIEKDFKIIENS